MEKERENSYWKMKISLERIGTHKHTETYLRYFDDHRCLSRSEKSKCIYIYIYIFVHLYCGSHTFIFFWLRKTSVSIKMYQLSFCVCISVFHLKTLHFFSKGFHFLFLFLCYPFLGIFSFHIIMNKRCLWKCKSFMETIILVCIGKLEEKL